ncbi:MAG: hypothetical protein GXO10_04955 [Crenarchaeota archaeon]|nr:hypothetical protein [Thermoproteota archaeon]
MAKELFVDQILVKYALPHRMPKDEIVPYAKRAADNVYNDVESTYLEDYMHFPDTKRTLVHYIGNYDDETQAKKMIKDKLTSETIELAQTFIAKLASEKVVTLSLIGGDADLYDILMVDHYRMFTLVDVLKDAMIIKTSILKTVWVDADPYQLKSVVPIMGC